MAQKIKNIHIEPADDGGFLVEVCRKAEQPKADTQGHIPYIPDDVKKHVCSNPEDLGEYVSSLFPKSTGRSRRGSQSSDIAGSTRSDSYEGGEGDEEEY